MRVVTFKIDHELLEELDSLARMKGVSRSEIIRKAIEEYIKRENRRMKAAITYRRIRLLG